MRLQFCGRPVLSIHNSDESFLIQSARTDRLKLSELRHRLQNVVTCDSLVLLPKRQESAHPNNCCTAFLQSNVYVLQQGVEHY